MENEAVVKEPSKAVKGFFEWFEMVLTAVVAVVIISLFLFRIATVKGDSMQNTLFENERVVITKLFYTPNKDDIVVISRNANNSSETKKYSQMPIIKRVIATEGQEVDIDFEKGVVYVDGVALDEPYTKTPTNTKGGVKFPVTVPKGSVFVLGDNRNASLDSRSTEIGENGMIDIRYIIGEVVLRISPFNKFGGLK